MDGCNDSNSIAATSWPAIAARVALHARNRAVVPPAEELPAYRLGANPTGRTPGVAMLAPVVLPSLPCAAVV